MIGLITLNFLAAVREEGEVVREVIVSELMAQTRSALRVVRAVPGPNLVDMVPIGYLSKVPGVDVAIGVTAYQLADTARTITLAALRGQRTTARVARALQSGLSRLWKPGAVPPQHDAEIARQAARGAMHAVSETTAELGQLTRPAMVGIVRALDEAHVSPYSALRRAAYGVIEGASETGIDLGQAATEVVAGAKEAARELNLKEDTAAEQAARGAMEAAEMLGRQAIIHVREALPDELIAKSSGPEEESYNTAGDQNQI